MLTTRSLSLAVCATFAALLPAQLAGTYSVGPAGNFATLAAAISTLNSQGVAGPVTFLVLNNNSGP